MATNTQLKERKIPGGKAHTQQNEMGDYKDIKRVREFIKTNNNKDIITVGLETTNLTPVGNHLRERLEDVFFLQESLCFDKYISLYKFLTTLKSESMSSRG